MDQRACELARAEEDCRHAINMATKDFNDALNREKKTKEELANQQELDDNFTEISNNVFGDMLTENPDVAQSAFGSHRVITDRWKGMSPAQLAEIRYQQQEQLKEKEVSLSEFDRNYCFFCFPENLACLSLKYVRGLEGFPINPFSIRACHTGNPAFRFKNQLKSLTHVHIYFKS